jgi:peptidoglycan biosynthesis protein MviN/MurJ (putative lipid II flippase)
MRLNIGLGSVAALQLAAGLAMQLVIIRSLGAGALTDAWVAAQTMPLVTFSVIAVAFQGAWQSRLATLDDSEYGRVVTQQAAHGQLMLVYGLTVLVLCLGSTWWTRLLFPGLPQPQHALVVQMSQLLLAGAYLNGHAALFATALRGRDRFLVAEVVTLASTLAAIAAVTLLIDNVGISGVAWISLARSALAVGVLYFFAGRPTPSLAAGWRDAESWKQLRPILAGASIYKCAPLVDRYWSSLAPMGGLTVFNLLQTGMAALGTVIERSISMPVAPRLARLAQSGDWTSMHQLLRQTMKRGAWATGCVAALIAAMYPVWPMLLGPLLKLDSTALRESWLTAVLLCAFLYPASVGSTVVSSFYAIADAKTPVMVGVAGFVVSIVVKALGFLYAGLPGLGAAVALYYLGNMAVMLWLLDRRLATKLAARG